MAIYDNLGSEQNKNMVKYNPETDCFDVYVNGVLIGSKSVGFKVPIALVPKITSDSFKVLKSNEIGILGSGAYYAWEAFNGTAADVHDCWADNKTAKGSAYLGYNFEEFKTVAKFFIKNVVIDSNGPYAPKSFILQGSNNLTEWYDIQSYSGHSTTLGYEKEYYVDNPKMYKAFRLLFTDWMTTSSNQTVAVCQLQFYGY